MVAEVASEMGLKMFVVKGKARRAAAAYPKGESGWWVPT